MARRSSSDKLIAAAIIEVFSIIFKFLNNVHQTKQWGKFFISTIPLVLLLIFACKTSTTNGNMLIVGGICIIIYIIYWYNNLSLNTARLNERYWKERQWWWELNGWEFEQEVANVFKVNGYKTKVTKGSGDYGVDIILEKDGMRYIVQCKHHRKPVPPEPIRALWGVKDDFKADGVILIASSGITQMGAEFVRKKSNFKVLNLDDIIELSKKGV